MWLKEISSHLLNSTHLINNFNQEGDPTLDNSKTGFLTSCYCILAVVLQKSIQNRMWWKLPFFALMGTTVLPGWNTIALPTVRPLTHERSIGAYRPGVEPQRNPAARRLPSLPVSHYTSISPFTSDSIEWFWKHEIEHLAFHYLPSLVPFFVWNGGQKVGANGIGARSLPPEHFASALFYSHGWRLSVPTGFDSRTQQLRMPCHCRPKNWEHLGWIWQAGHSR